MALFDSSGNPIASGRRPVYASRDAGSLRGSLQGWRGAQVYGQASATTERHRIQRRAADLAANDWCAASVLGAIQHNAIGTGLQPSSQLPAEKLGLSEAQAHAIGRRMEWLFWQWSRSADACGQMTFAELQFLGLRTLLAQGEITHLPVMLPKSQVSGFSLALQALAPARLRTPASLESQPSIRDGIRFSAWGRPEAYYIATPADNGTSFLQDGEDADSYVIVPARIAHRPGFFHLFVQQEEEQVRGESIFANSINLFRHLDDALAFELLAQNLATKFAVFISRESSAGIMPGAYQAGETEEERHFYTTVSGPEIMYGNEGEKPEMLKKARHGIR